LKTTLLILGILLIATHFVLLCLYALTPWEPYRGWAGVIAWLVSVIFGWGSMIIYMWEKEGKS